MICPFLLLQVDFLCVDIVKNNRQQHFNMGDLNKFL